MEYKIDDLKNMARLLSGLGNVDLPESIRIDETALYECCYDMGWKTTVLDDNNYSVGILSDFLPQLSDGKISFDNGEKRIYDMRPLLKKGTVFESFADIENFRRVYIDDQHSVAWDIDPNVNSDEVWNNKVDLCSDACYIDSIPVGGAPRA